MDALLRGNPEPQILLEHVRCTDMRALITKAWRTFKQQVIERPESERRALLCGAVSHFAERLRLNAREDGAVLDIARVHTRADHLYSTSGYSIWFAPAGFSYELQLYSQGETQLSAPRRVTVTPQAPLLVAGGLTVVDTCLADTDGHLVFSINLPISGSDIQVFERQSLSRIAWFPADSEVPRYLLLLEALENMGDPGLERVAGELLYHHHPAVRWQAFLQLMRFTPEHLEHYREVLNGLADPGLRQMLSDYLARKPA
ncbi:hypothetical protein N5F23_03185 [Pseudomonas sichuanensis]|uniref:hypothetical protein n=1 Tax=Pseudomonas sichuanensis TaxID=2213015 RepID=UPI00244807E5|nr:hypothetical protein [Pseudomonas sichuanensis]MDH0731760.1 hypothetical protein [Pseudomonas sichuanensis]MDH1581597.1 hypothetical protein [Pseudomonas sichuanensis]MDH1594629.1 hypothetical protein [Pseudomonas sichuanensis]MDH1599246.1 hypothetical protein [Pseudomonas sichuanensis]